LLRCSKAAVAGDQDVVLIDEERIGEPKLTDGGGDLGDLIGRMRPCIP
jgi:hypothetical protein